VSTGLGSLGKRITCKGNDGPCRQEQLFHTIFFGISRRFSAVFVSIKRNYLVFYKTTAFYRVYVADSEIGPWGGEPRGTGQRVAAGRFSGAISTIRGLFSTSRKRTLPSVRPVPIIRLRCKFPFAGGGKW